MDQRISSLIGSIGPLDEATMERARARQSALAKPPHSLGRLEDLSIQISGICGEDADMTKGRVIVFAADNGVADEAVTSAPKSVTRIQAMNIARGFSGAGVLCRQFGAECEVVDIGIDWDRPLPGLVDSRIRRGTGSIAKGPALTRDEAERAILAGAEAVSRAREQGIGLIGIGEMGIGNTTTSSAVLSALMELPASETAGRGGGIDDEMLANKIAIIDAAIARLHPDPGDAIDVLGKVGGLDLCAMTGAYLSVAANRMPVVIDGFISATAALCAARLAPRAADYMIPSHTSIEKAYALIMRKLGLKPMLTLDMRLGEGSGCPIAFSIVRAAMAVYRDMATFEDLSIDDHYLDGIRDDRRLRGDFA
ncbi:MAG: nicotinate-nucleotide--dimethylbenzimidazole phosphoribosyltransferase [Clostridiales bacterium]|nr:nicotinate-nucleotide--dimethylbenzimidazole phosphoribosyltransferase [Clostridiales bacterium]